MDLYMVQIGFRLPKMYAEGHDTLFAVAENKEAAFKQNPEIFLNFFQKLIVQKCRRSAKL